MSLDRDAGRASLRVNPGSARVRPFLVTALAAPRIIDQLTGVEMTHLRGGLEEAVRGRVRQDLGAAVQARLVVPSPDRLRVGLGGPGERVLRSLCRDPFTPHTVTAQVPLRRVLDVSVMNALLDEEDRSFLANASVHLDVVVEHHETEAPLLALELDGPQHGRSPQLERDVRKDRILRVSGLPLLRLWTDEPEPPAEGLLRVYLAWRLRRALRDPAFREAAPPALREVLDRLGQEEHDCSEGSRR